VYDGKKLKGNTMEIIVLAVLSGVLTAVIAQMKNYSGPLWFVLGFFFPVVAPVVIIFFKQTLTEENAPPSPKTHVKCPDCKELVRKEARVCKHCGCKLVPEGANEAKHEQPVKVYELSDDEKKTKEECLQILQMAEYSLDKENKSASGVTWTIKSKSGNTFDFGSVDELKKFAEIYKKN
jgi:hypothetical protein